MSEFFSRLSASNAYDGTLYCMFDGEYGEHSLLELGITKNQIDQTLDVQKESYAKYIGKDFGDFKCENIEYDWFRHWPVWTVRCNLCGAVLKKENGYQWSRGKTTSMLCGCRKERKAAEREAELRRIDERKARIEQEYKAEIGKLYGNYEVIDCNGFGDGKCVVKCTKCGAIRKAYGINKLRNGIFQQCNCGVVNYSDPNLVGTRRGHAVFMGMDGAYAHIVCDCGRDRYVSATGFFKYKVYRDCGSSDCEYASDYQKKSRTNKSKGESFEIKTEMMLRTNGYDVKHVGKTGDYGVDLIAEKDGIKIAVQCKCNTGTSVGVNAVQEVYAGGRYYDLEHFAVVTYNGISRAAAKLAKKLGVYIGEGDIFDYPHDLETYSKNLIPTIKAQNHNQSRKLYEYKGEFKTIEDWAYILNVVPQYVRIAMKKGVTFETALEYARECKDKRRKYVVNGIEGSIVELCEHFRVVTAETARYRIKRGFDVEKAILTPPTITGRPKKIKHEPQNPA